MSGSSNFMGKKDFCCICSFSRLVIKTFHDCFVPLPDDAHQLSLEVSSLKLHKARAAMQRAFLYEKMFTRWNSMQTRLNCITLEGGKVCYFSRILNVKLSPLNKYIVINLVSDFGKQNN